MSAAWMELHNTLLDHPKVFRLSRSLQTNKFTALGVVTALWCWACRNAEDGDLSKYSAHEIARGISWHRKVDFLFKGLIEAGFVDDIEGRLFIHDWDKHGIRCLKKSRVRQEAFRKKGESESQHKSSSGALNAAKNALPK